MMISREQAHAAAVRLRNGASGARVHGSGDVSPEVFAAALAVVENTPDTSPQRIAEARRYLASDGADSHVVASMMIQRIICDSLR